MAVIIAAPCPASSQPVFDRPSNDTQRRIIEEIRETELQKGPNSADLLEPLTTLGILYFESGDPVLAAVANRRALEIVRITYGLHSLEQAPLVRQLIANHEAIGQTSAAWDLEQKLLTLAERHPDDLRTVPIFRETADRRMEFLEQYLAGEFPAQIVLGCYYGWPRTAFQRMDEMSRGMTRCSSGSRSHAIQTLTVDAQKYYAKAIAVVHRNEQYSGEVLRELEMEIVSCSDFLRDYDDAGPLQISNMTDVDPLSLHLRPWRSWVEAMSQVADWNPWSQDRTEKRQEPWRPVQYGIARHSLERLFAYEVMTSGPWQKQADAVIQIADWDLLYSRNAAALREYEHVHRQLTQMDIEKASIDRIFQPEIPVVLPAFRPNPLKTTDTAQTRGYIDVAFEITKYGGSKRVEILETTTQVSATDVDDLVKLIKRSLFRPRIDESGSARRTRVELRYYANE